MAGFKASMFEVIFYLDSIKVDISEVLKSRSVIKDWAYIKHDMCVGSNGKKLKEHVHLYFRFRPGYTNSSVYVAEWFQVNHNQVSRIKGRFVDAMMYMTHLNAPEKYQYDAELVVSNFDWKSLVSKRMGVKREDEIIGGIVEGDIRRFNYHQFISGAEYVRYKRKIESAFKYREDKMKGSDRSMEAIFISGKSGSGKTTYAKMLADEKGFSYFISSGSNDVLDGYEGQDCIILDDLRPSCMGLSDLLKMLDNHTASSVKSRYYNKVLECKLIIVTTVLDIDSFFKNVFDNESEPIVQLKRRCRMHIVMDLEYMEVYLFDDVLRDYEYVMTIVNPVAKIYKIKRQSFDDKMRAIEDMLGDVSVYECSVKETAKSLFGF